MISPDLLQRLRARARDPRRRTDYAPSLLQRTIASMSREEMIAERRRFIERLNEATHSPPDKSRHEQAKRLDDLIKTPSPSPLPEPVSMQRIEKAEAELGIAIPAPLATLYLEVGDGGFGPGAGFLPLHRVVAGYRKLLSRKSGKPWPAEKLTILIAGTFFHCIDLGTGEIWCIDGSAPRDEETDFLGLFELTEPSLASWLEAWLNREPTGNPAS